jgi:hypothetical protein
MTRHWPVFIFIFVIFFGTVFASETAIRDILAFPKSYEGRLLDLSGTISNVKPLTPAGFYFFVLGDKNGNTIRVRTSRRGRTDGLACSLKGRLRADPLQGGYFIVEEEVLLDVRALVGDQAPPPPPPPARIEAAAAAEAPASTTVDPGTETGSEPEATSSAPALVPTAALPGDYGQLFETASAGLKDLFISEVGRLAVSVLHPTCTFSSNQLESNYRLGGAGRASFRTAYNGLLIGDREMRWEVIFDANGMLSDVRLVSDTSPLTNVALINTVKDRVAGLIKSYIERIVQGAGR